jgi:hypothetical protein
LQREHDVLDDGHVRPDRVRLEDDADRPPVRADEDAVRRVGDHLAADLDGAGVGAFQPGDQPQRGGLAAAARAEQRDEPALRDLQVDAVDGVGPGRPARVALREAGQLDH